MKRVPVTKSRLSPLLQLARRVVAILLVTFLLAGAVYGIRFALTDVIPFVFGFILEDGGALLRQAGVAQAAISDTRMVVASIVGALLVYGLICFLLVLLVLSISRITLRIRAQINAHDEITQGAERQSGRRWKGAGLMFKAKSDDD